MHKEHPEVISIMSKGHAFDLKSNVFEKLPNIFLEEKPEDGNEYIQVLGRKNNSRVFKYIRKDYVNNVKNLFYYKVFMPKAVGSGEFGEIFSNLLIGLPATGNTETFISIGIFDSEICAINTRKYISTKFARSLLGILKTTQDITPERPPAGLHPQQRHRLEQIYRRNRPSALQKIWLDPRRNKIHRNPCKGDGISVKNQHTDDQNGYAALLLLFNSHDNRP